MKKYEKPMLISMELAGNEQLCGSCANKDIRLYNNPGLAELFGISIGADLTVIDRSDFANAFGSTEAESGCSPSQLIEGYCKFTGSLTSVAWS